MVTRNRKAAYDDWVASVKQEVYEIDCIELSQPGNVRFVERYYTNTGEDVEVTLEDGTTKQTFVHFPYSFKQPTIDQTSAPTSDIQVCNIGLELSEVIEELSQTNLPLVVKYRQYMSDDLTEPVYNKPLKLTMTQVSDDEKTFTGKLFWRDFANRKFPNFIMNQENFPGLRYV